MTKEEFSRQVVGYTDTMYRVAYAILRNDEDCRDAMQEAALKAWEKRKSLRREEYFLTWLTRILINACHQILRGRKRMIPMEHTPEQAAPAQDRALRDALGRLPEKLRLPLIMTALEGMTYEEAARALKITVSAVTGRVHRAKELLRKEMSA